MGGSSQVPQRPEETGPPADANKRSLKEKQAAVKAAVTGAPPGAPP